MALWVVVYRPMMDVPHDQPIRFTLATWRCFSTKSTTDPTSLAAVAVSTIGLASAAGRSISAGRVERL